jgi:hypothetical protein
MRHLRLLTESTESQSPRSTSETRHIYRGAVRCNEDHWHPTRFPNLDGP